MQKTTSTIDRLILHGPDFIVALLIVVAFCCLAVIGYRAVIRYGKRKGIDEDISTYFAQITKVTFIILGFAISFGALVVIQIESMQKESLQLSMMLQSVLYSLLPRIALGLFPKIIVGLLVFCAFYFASTACQKAALRLCQLKNLDKDVSNFLAQIVKTTLLVIGIVSALGSLGVDVTAMVAGLGLTGFALGFAIKDLISNLLSGMMILIYQPFQRGDRISVTGFEGIVTEIDLRYTTLQDKEKKYLIPNSILFAKGISVTPSA